MTQDEEFNVFYRGDELNLADNDGSLFGVRPLDGNGELPCLGTREEQVAKFPYSAQNEVWHGYPVWPIASSGRGNLIRPIPTDVLAKMCDNNLITAVHCRRLKKGKHA